MKRILFLFIVIVLVLSVFGTSGCATKVKAEWVSPVDPTKRLNEIIAQEKMERDNFEFIPVYFDYNSAFLTKQTMDTLNSKSVWLRKHPGTKFVIIGHTDERGSDSFNFKLAFDRARVVRDYLKFLGNDTNLMTMLSAGKKIPADPGHFQAAWKENRRVNTRVIEMGPVQTRCN
jgi:Outer membrane protein and related peptidoglycan-associated (lipo)proteins